MKHLYLLFIAIFVFTSLQSVRAEDDSELSCPLECRQNVPINLGPSCTYTLQPMDVLHYPPTYCTYIITVYNGAGVPIGNTIDASHIGQTLSVKVTHDYESCWASIYVTGGGGPVAICDANTQVSLGSDGTARVYYTTFDDGSYAGCGGLSHIKVRRMTPGWCPPGVYDDTQFRDFVEFCCEDIAMSPVQVVMRVYDYSGNWNECMVNVYVEDKLPPTLVCPPDITVSCEYPYNPYNLSEFGTVRMSKANRQPIYINDPYYYPGGIAGYDGYVEGNCGMLWVQENSWSDLECGQGVIYREFTVEATNYSCIQKIYIKDPTPFTGSQIHWPADVDLQDCGPQNLDPDITGKPTFYDDFCSIIATTYKDEVFTVVPDACFKVLRHWSVIDWCQFNPGKPWKPGRWDYTQIIKLKSSDLPTFTACNDVTFCPEDASECNGYIQLKGEAYDDCTPDSLMGWHYCIDLYNDNSGPYPGNYDKVGYVQNASGVYPYGTHRIYWRVEDLCGNYNTCEFLFTVEDCKKPSPVCLHGISTVVMPSSGMIELAASAFNASSFDNCTPEAHLIYSYSEDVYETTRIFDCNSLGVNELQIWVTDAAGNQQYCTTYMILEDNDQVCPNNAIPLISGRVITVEGEPFPDATVTLDTRGIQIPGEISTDELGQYQFGSFADIEAADFDIALSKSDDALNGVTVLDLLLMQKHIAGLQDLDNAYALVAADVTGDKNIDIRDLIETRALMLDRKDNFSLQTSWMFAEDVIDLDIQNADYNAFTVLASTFEPVTLDLVAIKLADLNGTAKIDNGNRETFEEPTGAYVIKDRLVRSGDEILVPVYGKGIPNFAGIQFDISVDPAFADLMAISTSGDSEAEMDYETHENQSVHSIHLFPESDLRTNENPLFFLHVKVNRTSMLSEIVGIGKQTKNTAVSSDENEIGMSLEFMDSGLIDQVEITAFPNPFSQELTVLIKNQEGNEGRLDVLDQTGRLVGTYSILQDQKTMRITINKTDLSGSGVYWLRSNVGQHSSTNKIIFID